MLKRHDFADNPAVARVVSYGISFHQGELYGWLNVVQNVIAASFGVLLSVSGFVAWWMRRPKGHGGIHILRGPVHPGTLGAIEGQFFPVLGE